MKRIVALVFAILLPSSAFALDSATEMMNVCGFDPICAKKVTSIVNTLASPFPNNTWATFRNAANNGNINVLKVDGTDDTTLNADTGDTIKFEIAGTTELSLDNDLLTFSGAAARIVPGVTSLTFRNAANNADNLSITDAGLVTVRAGLTATTANITSTAGDFIASTSGKTLRLQEATAAAKCMGTGTLTAATPVVIATTCAETTSRIFLTRTSLDADTTGDMHVSAISNGVSFSVTAETNDTGTFNWLIINEAS